MFKLICYKESCINKNIVYYMYDVSNPSICGGCKDAIIPIEMSQEEYDLVFDYDPFVSNLMVGA